MKILFLAGRRFSTAPQNGGERVSLRNFEMLQRIFGAENVYLCMFTNKCDEGNLSLAKMIPTYHTKIELLINTISLRNVCNKRGKKALILYVEKLNPDMVFVDSSHVGKLVEACKIKVPIVIFFHNIEVNYTRNKFKHESIFYWFAHKSWGWNEKISVKLAECIILLNARDNRELNRIYGRTADYILPITFEDTFNPQNVDRSKHKKKKLLFVGSLFQPNYEGVLWFVNAVMPSLDASKYTLQIVGKDFEKRKGELELSENIEVIGTVDSLEQYYQTADAVIFPILYGDGMKVKTAEAMMYGKRIFATAEALEGYDVSDIKEIHRCDTKEAFVKCIDRFTTDDYQGRFYEEVRERFRAKYETKTIESGFGKMMKEIMGM